MDYDAWYADLIWLSLSKNLFQLLNLKFQVVSSIQVPLHTLASTTSNQNIPFFYEQDMYQQLFQNKM